MTKYGITTLSQADDEYDPESPWSGGISPSAEFFYLNALRHYGSQKGPYAKLARRLFNEGREGFLNAVNQGIGKNAYICEWYAADSGKCMGTKPHTSSSSALALLMLVELPF